MVKYQLHLIPMKIVPDDRFVISKKRNPRIEVVWGSKTLNRPTAPPPETS